MNVPSTQQVSDKTKATDLHNEDNFAKPQRTPGVRQGNPKQLGARTNSQSRFQRAPNNWVDSQNNDGDNVTGTKLPPIATPSVQSIKSTAAPSIVPRKAMTKNSNKKTIKNAIMQVTHAGKSEQINREREILLDALEQADFT